MPSRLLREGVLLRKFFVIAIALFGSAPGPLLAGDRSPAPHFQAPSAVPRALMPEVQTDGFSCGYHALSAIYRSHGLDPQRARLRARLGTSNRAIPFVSDSTGTLQPDLFRVLLQDGFYTSSVRPDNFTDRNKLTEHLEDGLYCLALLKTERAGGLHWIVFTGLEQGEVLVADSLRRGLQRENLDQLAEDSLLRVILLYPGSPSPGSPYHRAHASGIGEMIATTFSTLPLAITIPLLLALVLGAWWLLRLLRSLLRRLMPRRTNP